MFVLPQYARLRMLRSMAMHIASAISRLNGQSGLNDTMVCNTAPIVWAAGEVKKETLAFEHTVM